jgi:hypothetical protein
MTIAIIGTGESDRSSPASSPQAARPCGSRAPTMSRQRWELFRSARHSDVCKPLWVTSYAAGDDLRGCS